MRGPRGEAAAPDASAGSRGTQGSQLTRGTQLAVSAFPGLHPALGLRFAAQSIPSSIPQSCSQPGSAVPASLPASTASPESWLMLFLLLPQQTSLSITAEIPSATLGGDSVGNWDQRCKAEFIPPLFSQISAQGYSLIQISGFSYYGNNHRLNCAGPEIYFFE